MATKKRLFGVPQKGSFSKSVVGGVFTEFITSQTFKVDIQNFIIKTEKKTEDVSWHNGWLGKKRYKDFTYVTLRDVGDKKYFSAVIRKAINQMDEKLPDCDELKDQLSSI